MNIKPFFPFIFVWLWSTGFIGAKFGLPYIEPNFMLSIRFACAICLLLILARIFKERSLTWIELKWQMIVGVLLHGVYLSGVFFALKTGMSAGIVSIIVGLQPLITALFSRLWMGESLKAIQAVGMILGFIGTFFVIYGSNKVGSSLVTTSGLITCIIAVLGVSSASILQKKVGQSLPLLGGASYQYMGAIVVVILLTAFTETQQVTVTTELVMALFWLVFGLSIAAILLLMVVIRSGDLSQVASYFYLVAPATVLQAWLFFGEELSLTSIIGCVVSVMGVYLVITSNPFKLFKRSSN